MTGAGAAREHADQRERRIARRVADALPAITVIGGVLLAVAIGAPIRP